MCDDECRFVVDGVGRDQTLNSKMTSNSIISPTINSNVEQKTGFEFDYLVETVSCYKCKLCSRILSNEQEVDEHVRMFHLSAIKQLEKLEEIDSTFDVPLSDPDLENETDLYICRPCKKGFLGLDLFTVHMTDAHRLSTGSIQLEPLVLTDESDFQSNSMHQQRQISFAPSSTLQYDKYEVVQIENLLTSNGTQKKKRNPDGEKEDSKDHANEAVENVEKKDDESNVLEALKGSESTDGDSSSNKKRVCSNTTKRKIVKDMTSSSDEAVVVNRYWCKLNGCCVRLRSLENLEYHRKCHSKESDGFVCHECNEEYDHWKDLCTHLWKTHLIDMEPYLCDVCGKGFKTSKQLRNHKIVHLGKHASRRSGECEICHRYFSDKRMLRVHKDMVHNKLRPYLCNYCSYSTACRSGLKLHVRQHTGEKPFACDSCDYRTTDHNSLRKHKMRHSGEKPYKCPFCVYACIQSSTYKAHLKSKHPGMDEGLMFCCDQCSFRTIKKASYVSHMTYHDESDTSTPENKTGKTETPPTSRLPLRVVLSTETRETQELAVREVLITDDSVLEQQIDDVTTDARFFFSVLEDGNSSEVNSKVFNVKVENHEEKFPFLAGQLVSNKATESSSTTEIDLIGTHFQILRS